jgi:hypothetical protein
MAACVPFPEANLVLTGPQGPEDPDVSTVMARALEGTVVTCWQLSETDLEALIANGGKVWLSVWGRTMPPAMITAVKAEVI